MNKAISLMKLLEETAYLKDESRKNLSGSISNSEDLAANAPALEALHKGLFAFLAFHPGTDKEVAEYVERGSLSSDSGTDILVLFFSATEHRMPRAVAAKDLGLGLDLDLALHPAYEFARWLFPSEKMLRFPGLIFFDRVFDVVDAVYAPFPAHTRVSEIAGFCRSAFMIAGDVVSRREPGEPISFDALSLAFKSNGIGYLRTGSPSAGEWLFSAYSIAKKHGGTIASIVAKIAKSL